MMYPQEKIQEKVIKNLGYLSILKIINIKSKWHFESI